MQKKNLLRRWGAAVLSGALLWGALPLPASASTASAASAVSDINGHWAEGVIKRWQAEGAISADAAGSLRPDDPVTRAEFMAFANRALKLTEQSEQVSQYKDVAPGAWYYSEVAKALSAGYISGTAPDRMSPEDYITNEQAYVMLTRIGKAQGAGDLSGVADRQAISPWAVSAVEKAVANGYIAGYKGRIHPGGRATRAQAVVLLDRFKSNDRVFAFPGVYTLKSVKNLSILVNGVTLKDSIIQGDLTLGADVSEVKTQNTKIKGKTVKHNPNAVIVSLSALQDGTYEGLANAYGGVIRLQATIKDGRIAAVEILKHSETSYYMRQAMQIVDKIVKTGSLDGVDTISGATISSRGILNALKDILSQAAGKTQKPGESEEGKAQNSGGGHGGGNKPTEPQKQDYAKLPDGKYKGKAMGYGGYIYVTVTAEGGRIAQVSVDSHSETSSYYNTALAVIREIIKKSSTNVDTISGATVSSKGIMAAVENALSAIQGQPAEKAYADGLWYGQGRGHYSFDGDTPFAKYRPFEASVTVEKGKITDVQLLHFGDDAIYNRPDGYRIIGDYVKENQGTGKLFEIFASKNGPAYDGISGATNSARGFVNAIDDALSRSVKFQKDKIPQEIRSVALIQPSSGKSIIYGEEVDLSDYSVKVKYLNGDTEDLPYSRLAEKGIKSTLPLKFTMTPDDESRYDVPKDFLLTLSHEKSTSKHSTFMQAKRRLVRKEIKELVFQIADGTEYKVPIVDDFNYAVDLGSGKPPNVTQVTAVDLDGAPVKIKRFSLESYNKPTLVVELEPMAPAKPEDKVQYTYKYSNFSVALTTDLELDKEGIVSFRLSSQPVKTSYSIGEPLDLTGLQIQAKDSSGIRQVIDTASLADYGFTVTPSDGSVLDKAGLTEVAITHKSLPDAKASFEISVSDTAERPDKIDLENGAGSVVATVMLKDGVRVYHGIKVPDEHKTQPLYVKLYTAQGALVEPYEIIYKPGANLLQVYFTEDSYAFLGLVYVAAPADAPLAVPAPEAPTPDASKPDAPKPDALKPEESKPEAPMPNAPKPDAPKPGALKPEESKPDAPKPEDRMSA